jgi:hypothetical protein
MASKLELNRSEKRDLVELASDLGETCERYALRAWNGATDYELITHSAFEGELNSVKQAITIPAREITSRQAAGIYQNLSIGYYGLFEGLSQVFGGESFTEFWMELAQDERDPGKSGLGIRCLIEAAIICGKQVTGEEKPPFVGTNTTQRLVEDICFFGVSDPNNGSDWIQESYLDQPKVMVRESGRDLQAIKKTRKGRYRYSSPLMQFDGVLVDEGSACTSKNKTDFLNVCGQRGYEVVEIKTIFDVTQAYKEEALAKPRPRDIRQFERRLGVAMLALGRDFHLPRAVNFCYLRGMTSSKFHRLELDDSYLKKWRGRLCQELQSGENIKKQEILGMLNMYS